MTCTYDNMCLCEVCIFFFILSFILSHAPENIPGGPWFPQQLTLCGMVSPILLYSLYHNALRVHTYQVVTIDYGPMILSCLILFHDRAVGNVNHYPTKPEKRKLDGFCESMNQMDAWSSHKDLCHVPSQLLCSNSVDLSI